MPLAQGQLKDIFGAFSYKEDPKRKGAIVIDPAWVKRNIVHIITPLGSFSCHRLISYQIQVFIAEGISEGLVTDIGGIWVPRHILWDVKRPLSGHAHGCDIDINVDDGEDGPGGALNYGENSLQPARLIEIAAIWGFEWGGAWRKGRDGMHFSCVEIVNESELKIGSRGPRVKELQRKLNARGYMLMADGLFGPKTRAALLDWQKKQGMQASGQADYETWKSLINY